MSGPIKTSVATSGRTHWEEWLWQRCLAPKTSLILFALVILGLLVGQLVPQLPDDARSDPTAYDRWLQTIPERFRSVESTLNRLGLFDIRNGLWFQALLVVAATVGLVALGGRFAVLHPQQALLQPLSFSQDDTDVPIPETLVNALIQSVRTLVGTAYQATAGNRTAIYGRRPGWTQPLATLTCLGLLLTVVGIAIDIRWGWDLSAIALSPQTTIRVAPNATLSLVSFDRAHAQAVLQTGSAQFTVGKKAASTGRLICRVVDIGGVHVQIRAVNRDGTRLDLYPYADQGGSVQTLTMVFPVDVQEDNVVFFVPSQNIVVQLGWTEQSGLRLDLTDGAGQRLAEHTLPISTETIEINDTGLQIAATFYPTVALSYRPGYWLLPVGTLLVLLGGVFDAIPVESIGIVVAGEAERILVRVWPLLRRPSWMEKVVQQVEVALHASGASIEYHSVEEQ